MQIGAREKLLCRQCEEQLQRYEDYFARYWYQRPAPAHGTLDKELVIRDIDYLKLKLLILSILWRASVAQQPMFSSASLGPKHGEAIREMILREAPGSKSDYPIIAGLIVEPATKALWDKVLLAPLRMKVKTLWAYRLVFGGACWTIFVSRHTRPPVESHWLTESGSLPLTCISYEDFARHSGMIEAAKEVEL